jgi:hypothetical protein
MDSAHLKESSRDMERIEKSVADDDVRNGSLSEIRKSTRRTDRQQRDE